MCLEIKEEVTLDFSIGKKGGRPLGQDKKIFQQFIAILSAHVETTTFVYFNPGLVSGITYLTGDPKRVI